MPAFAHFVAIDWSGAVGPRQPGIAIAICGAGRAAPTLVEPGRVWGRIDCLDWLVAGVPANSLIGFDLGPAFPHADHGAYFPGWDATPADAPALWALVDRLCAADEHLAASSFVDHDQASRYFRRHGGRTGDRFGSGRGRLRVTEEAQRDQGLNPYSNFNLVGAAQVGKSSLTGMRLFHRLQHHMPIWPFDDRPAQGSVALEIYTSLAARAAGRPRGRSKMKTVSALNEALRHPAIDSDPHPGGGTIADHAADAILTSAWLRGHADRPALWQPAGMTPAVARTEGWTFGVV